MGRSFKRQWDNFVQYGFLRLLLIGKPPLPEAAGNKLTPRKV